MIVKISFLLIIISLLACAESNEAQQDLPLQSQVCNCLNQQKSSDPKTDALLFSDCIYPFFKDSWKNPEVTKENFPAKLEKFLVLMDKSCSEFLPRAKKWFSPESTYYDNLNVPDSIKLSQDSCRILKKKNWFYADQLMGKVKFTFERSELIKTSIKYNDQSVYSITPIDECSCQLTFKKSENPFSLLIPDGNAEGIHLVSYSNDTLKAYYEVALNVYMKIELTQK